METVEIRKCCYGCKHLAVTVYKDEKILASPCKLYMCCGRTAKQVNLPLTEVCDDFEPID